MKAKKLPPIERLRELFICDEINGILVRRVDSYNCVKIKGETAGSNEEYSRVRVDGERHTVHRIIHFMSTGEQPEMVDHKNGDKKKNSSSNLRSADRYKNQHNQRAIRSSSGYKNVIYIKATDKYAVRFQSIGEARSFGHYKSKVQAMLVATYQRWIYNGEFANNGELA